MKFYILPAYCLLLLPLLCSCAGNPLIRATENGESAIVNTLLSQGTPADGRGGPMDETALLVAARHGNLGIAKTLLNAGASINALSKYRDTPLTAATAFCHSQVTEFLIDQGADVNVKNYGYGSTPLILASECPWGRY